MLYLVHRRNEDGKPIGIWSGPDKSFYEPDAKDYQATAARLIGHRRHFPWDEIVDRLVGTANMKYLFADVEDDDTDMEAVLRSVQE